MQNDRFYQWGLCIHAFRWWILSITLIALFICLPLIPKVLNSFTTTGFVNPSSQSGITDNYLKSHLNYRRNQFIIMYEGKNKFTKDSGNFTAIRNSLEPLTKSKFKTEIIYPDDNEKQISKNKSIAYAVVFLKTNQLLSDEELNAFKAKIKKPVNLKMSIGGEPIFLSDTNKQTQKDLIRAEYIATPLAIITLLIVFGSLVAAIVPMILDGICAIFILSILAGVGHHLTLSVFTLNIALLLGLCLSLDYALFIVSRFREELAKGAELKVAIAKTQSTAGKAIFFSGLAVFASLSALLFFPINILFSVGVGGIAAVFVSVFVCLVILPAMLAILGTKINFLTIGIFKNHHQTQSVWMWLVTRVVKHPWPYFISILCLLLFLGYPLLNINIGISDYHILPKDVVSRHVFDTFDTAFNDNQLAPIVIMAKTKNGPILTENNISLIYNLIQKIADDNRVDRVESIVSTTPKLSKKEYQHLYTTEKEHLPESLKQLLKLTTKNNFTIANVISKYPKESPQTKALVSSLRDMKVPKQISLKVTGQSANMMDVTQAIKHIFPYAFIWVIVFSYVILLFLLRSLFLPIKAILMNILSLFASYGVLVTIIQKGYFASLLNFEPQGIIDISLLIIIFCALFGFSMDYEVFLLSRIKEYYEKTQDNIQSICFGITHSSRIITSAAIIVILICFSFISADILLVKAFGLGIAIAIFVDAFLIRTLLVPAIMAILGKWNWYLPRFLDRILPTFPFDLH